MIEARLAAQLIVQRAVIIDSHGPALSGDRLQVSGSAFFSEGFSAFGQGSRGTIRLPGSSVGADIDFANALIVNESGPAIGMDGVSVTGVLIFRQVTSISGAGDLGAVRLLDAEIRSQLDLRGASIENSTGVALAIEGTLSVFMDGDFIAKGSGAPGTVRMSEVSIGGRLHCFAEQEARLTLSTGGS